MPAGDPKDSLSQQVAQDMADLDWLAIVHQTGGQAVNQRALPVGHVQ
jgi:hypothetical protein